MSRARTQYKLVGRYLNGNDTKYYGLVSEDNKQVKYTSEQMAFAVASSYGKYLYTLEINDRAFVDMRKKANCTKYIRKIIGAVYKETGVNIGMYFDFQYTIDRLYYGGQAVFSVGHDIAEVLDNTDEFYDSGLSQTKKSNVYRILRRMDKECPKAYMFNYHIKNIGVIKDVSEEYVRIIKRENIGFGVISG